MSARVLVAYASKLGSTAEIAQTMAQTLRDGGHRAVAMPAREVTSLDDWDAVVLGSALYMFHWLREASSFARRNSAALAGKPVWLFSSGPLGPGTVDKRGRDLREVSGPREIEQLRRLLHPRDHRVFFGAWDQGNKPIGFWERIALRMPTTRAGLPNVDLRDWPNIEAWADSIAAELSGAAGAS